MYTWWPLIRSTFGAAKKGTEMIRCSEEIQCTICKINIRDLSRRKSLILKTRERTTARYLSNRNSIQIEKEFAQFLRLSDELKREREREREGERERGREREDFSSLREAETL